MSSVEQFCSIYVCQFEFVHNWGHFSLSMLGDGYNFFVLIPDECINGNYFVSRL